VVDRVGDVVVDRLRAGLRVVVGQGVAQLRAALGGAVLVGVADADSGQAAVQRDDGVVRPPRRLQAVEVGVRHQDGLAAGAERGGQALGHRLRGLGLARLARLLAQRPDAVLLDVEVAGLDDDHGNPPGQLAS